jgi:outer membrane protein TolC
VALLYKADRLDTDSLFITLNPNWTQNLVLEGTQPILRGAGDVVMVDIRRSRNGLRISQEGQRSTMETVLLEVVRTYWGLVLAQEEILARRKSEEVAAELLRDAEARYKAKVGTPLQVAEARAGLEFRIGNRIEAERERGNAQDYLRTLIYPFSADTTERGLYVIATSGEEATQGMAPDPNQLDHYVQLALANRPSLRATQWGIQNRSLDVYQAANAVKPQLDFVGRVGTAGLAEPFGQSLEEMVTGQALQATAGVQFSIFVGRRAARANLRLAEWARRQSVVDLKEQENLVILEVRTAVRDVVAAKAREDAARAEVVSAQANLRGERALLDNGKSTPFNVLLKEDELTNARMRVFRTQAERRAAEARFWRSLGMLADTLGVAGTVAPAAE